MHTHKRIKLVRAATNGCFTDCSAKCLKRVTICSKPKDNEITVEWASDLKNWNRKLFEFLPTRKDWENQLVIRRVVVWFAFDQQLQFAIYCRISQRNTKHPHIWETETKGSNLPKSQLFLFSFLSYQPCLEFCFCVWNLQNSAYEERKVKPWASNSVACVELENLRVWT